MPVDLARVLESSPYIVSKSYFFYAYNFSGGAFTVYSTMLLESAVKTPSEKKNKKFDLLTINEL